MDMYRSILLMVQYLYKVSENGQNERKKSDLGNAEGANYLKMSNPKREAFKIFAHQISVKQ